MPVITVRGKKYHKITFKRYRRFPPGSALLIPVGAKKKGRKVRRRRRRRRS